jgi:hypothetical protein
MFLLVRFTFFSMQFTFPKGFFFSAFWLPLVLYNKQTTFAQSSILFFEMQERTTSGSMDENNTLKLFFFL